MADAATDAGVVDVPGVDVEVAGIGVALTPESVGVAAIGVTDAPGPIEIGVGVELSAIAVEADSDVLPTATKASTPSMKVRQFRMRRQTG